MSYLALEFHSFLSTMPAMAFCYSVLGRYVDMIANPEVADVFRIRAKVVKREHSLYFFFYF
jgi:hypothetical protein